MKKRILEDKLRYLYMTNYNGESMYDIQVDEGMYWRSTGIYVPNDNKLTSSSRYDNKLINGELRVYKLKNET